MCTIHIDIIMPVQHGSADGHQKKAQRSVSYVNDVFAGDGAEQDVYVFGPSKPIRSFTGVVTAVLHRLNDCEDKWIVNTGGSRPDKDEILRAIAFQEQYFMGELYECADC